MRFRGFGISLAASAAMALFSYAPTATAGVLSEANCTGGGVIVTATTIDFTNPVGGGFGCIVTGIGTNVFVGAGSTIGPGVFGQILDLPTTPPTPAGSPVPNFITFNSGPGATFPGVAFDLSFLGPGSPLLTCGPLVGDSCSAFAGSPFILTRTATGTSVSLSATGNYRNGATVLGGWNGAFTTQLPGETPEQVISNINRGGSETSTQSGAFITTVPEPGTVSMSLLGGLMVAAAAFRRKK